MHSFMTINSQKSKCIAKFIKPQVLTALVFLLLTH